MRTPNDAYGMMAANIAIAGATVHQPTRSAVASPAATVQAFDFAEALYQTEPLASGSRDAIQAADFVTKGTARVRGLLPETAYRMVTSSRDLMSFIVGPHPTGKTAEIVVAAEFREFHSSGEARMSNAPRHVSPNVVDVRLSPDSASRRDLIFQVQTGDGAVVVAGGQVKTGTGQYVSESLIKMAQTQGYGRTGYVDARFVNPDGAPRIAQDAFTASQAQRLSEARVKLRGIHDLEERARLLVQNIAQYQNDGLNPVAREMLLRLRDDIASAYTMTGVANRAVGSAASAAASSTILNLIVQVASGGQVNVAQLALSAANAASWGAGTVAAESLIFHAATDMGLVPEAARAVAQRTVAIGCCVIGIVGDALAEAKAVREGQASVGDAISAGSLKAAMGMLPLIMPTLGISVPILAAVQIGGRWALAALRNSEQSLQRAIAKDFQMVAELERRLDQMGESAARLKGECHETDRIFEQVMGTGTNRRLRLVK